MITDPDEITTRLIGFWLSEKDTHVLEHSRLDYHVRDFSPNSYDERQYGSPGINRPVGCLTRTPLDCLPQYHIWADNLEPVQPASLTDSWSKRGGSAKILERNCCYLNLNPHCKPQLGRLRLYSHLGVHYAAQLDQAALWVLSLSDGMHSLLDEAEQSGLKFNLIQRVAEALLRCELLAPIQEGESP